VSRIKNVIATSIVHSKLDYCNFLYHNFPIYRLNRLQQIQNYLARAVVKAPESSHITPILKSLHWLKVNERIEYKLLSLTYNVLTTSQPVDWLYIHIHTYITICRARCVDSTEYMSNQRRCR